MQQPANAAAQPPLDRTPRRVTIRLTRKAVLAQPRYQQQHPRAQRSSPSRPLPISAQQSSVTGQRSPTAQRQFDNRHGSSCRISVSANENRRSQSWPTSMRRCLQVYASGLRVEQTMGLFGSSSDEESEGGALFSSSVPKPSGGGGGLFDGVESEGGSEAGLFGPSPAPAPVAALAAKPAVVSGLFDTGDSDSESEALLSLVEVPQAQKAKPLFGGSEAGDDESEDGLFAPARAPAPASQRQNGLFAAPAPTPASALAPVSQQQSQSQSQQQQPQPQPQPQPQQQPQQQHRQDDSSAQPAAAREAESADVQPPGERAAPKVIGGLFDDSDDDELTPAPASEPLLTGGDADVLDAPKQPTSSPAATAPTVNDSLFGDDLGMAPAPVTRRPRPAPKTEVVELDDWLADAPLVAGEKPPKVAVSQTVGPKAALSLELELELIDLQLAMDEPGKSLAKLEPQPSAASSPPAEPSVPKLRSRRKEKRAARRRQLQMHGRPADGPAACDATSQRRPAVPKLPGQTGCQLHDRLISRDWTAAERALMAEPGSASVVAHGIAEASIVRNRGRGSDLLALHIALLYGAPTELVSDILAAYPRAARQPVSASAGGIHGRDLLPLHMAVLRRCDSDLINLLIATNAGAAAHACSGVRGFSRLLPLHLAIIMGLTAAVTRQILTANATALQIPCIKPPPTERSRTFGKRVSVTTLAIEPMTFLPIHLAAMAASPPDVVRLLLTPWPKSTFERAPRVATRTRYGNGFLVDAMPLHLAIVIGSRVAPDRAPETVRQLLACSPSAAKATCEADMFVQSRHAAHIRQRTQESPWVVAKLLPLHLALIHRVPADMISLLLRTSIEGASIPALPRFSRADCDQADVSTYNNTRATFVLGVGPINDHFAVHLALLNDAPLEIVRDILEHKPETAQVACRPFYDPACEGASGCLPLHLAIFKKAAPEIVQVVIDAYVEAAASCLEVGIRGLANVLPIHIALMVGAPLATLHALLIAHPAGAEAMCWLRQWEHRVTPLALAHDNVASFNSDKTKNKLYLWRPSHGRSFDHAAGKDAQKLFECFDLFPESDVAAVVRAVRYFGWKEMIHSGVDVVRVVQTWILRWLYRFRYLRLQRVSIVLEAKGRRTVRYNQFQRLKRVTILTQTARRRIVALRNYQSQRCAAINAQSVRRGILARRERKAKLHAMAEMQRILRGRIYRNRFCQLRDGSRKTKLWGALVFQSMRRAKHVHQSFRDQKRAAVVVQCAYRNGVAVHRTRVKRTVQKCFENHAAIVVQQHARCFLATLLLARLRRERAATHIQSCARRRMAIRQTVGLKLIARVFRSYSSIVIQKFARRRLAILNLHRIRAAIHIQCCGRRMVAQRWRATRILVGKVFDSVLFQNAATNIQSRARGITGRKQAEVQRVFKATRVARECAATTVQCGWRSRVACQQVGARRLVAASWNSALLSFYVPKIQVHVRKLLARRRLAEARAAREYHQTTMRGSSLKELVEAIRDELGFEALLKPREVITEAMAYLGINADAAKGMTLLEAAQLVATELGLSIKTMRAGPAARAEMQRLQDELERAKRQLEEPVPAVAIVPFEESTLIQEPLPDLLLWESDHAHLGWWRVVGDETVRQPWSFTDTIDPCAHWTGRDAYDRKIPYNGWRRQAHPEELRELMTHLLKIRLSEFGSILRDSALHLQGRDMEIDAIALSALLMDLDIPRHRHKEFLRGFQFLLAKAGRQDVDADRLEPLLAPHGFTPVHVTALYQTIQWASHERSRLLHVLDIHTKAEDAFLKAEQERQERLRRQQESWRRTEAALAALKESSQDVILDEALRRIYFGLESRPQAMAALQQFDADGTGKLTEAQFIAAFDALYLQLSDQQSSLVMAVMTTEKDGLISIEEFCDLVYVVKLDRIQRRFEQANQRQTLWSRQREMAEQKMATRREQLAAHKQALESQIEKGIVDPVLVAASAAKAAAERDPTTAKAVPPPALEALLRALPSLDTSTLLYVFKASALRLQGRDTLIDRDDLVAALAPCGARNIKAVLLSCDWLLTKAGRPDATKPLLTTLLSPLGFGEEHFEVLFETVEWVRAGAAVAPVAPARQAEAAAAAEAAADRAAKQAEETFEQRVAAEVAKQIASQNLVARPPTPEPAEEVPKEDEADAPEEVVLAPPPPELEPLVARLPLVNKQALGRALVAAALDLLGREAEVDVENVVSTLASCGVPATEHGSLLQSCNSLLIMAGEDGALSVDGASSYGDGGLLGFMKRMGFDWGHRQALSETVAWVFDGAAVFDTPEFELTPEPEPEPEPKATRPAGTDSLKVAASRPGAQQLVDDAVEEEEEEELEKLTPPPVLEAVIYAAAWLDAAAWQVLVDSAAYEFVGCPGQINRPKLRSSLTECGIEGSDQAGVLEVRAHL